MNSFDWRGGKRFGNSSVILEDLAVPIFGENSKAAYHTYEYAAVEEKFRKPPIILKKRF